MEDFDIYLLPIIKRLAQIYSECYKEKQLIKGLGLIDYFVVNQLTIDQTTS